MKSYWRLGVLAVFFATTAAAQQSPASTYDIVAAKSTIEVGVFSGGLLQAFGHDHLIAAGEFSGSVRFDPERAAESSLTLTVAAGSLTVLDTGESEKDRRQVQATMLGEQVLDVASFPQIVFRSTGVKGVRKDATGWEVTVSGTLALHGIERPVTLPVRVRLDNARLHGQGEVLLSQSKFGIRPVTVAGGLVRVRDRVRVRYEVLAARDAL